MIACSEGMRQNKAEALDQDSHDELHHNNDQFMAVEAS